MNYDHFTSRAKLAVQNAMGKAVDLSHQQVTPTHLLFGLCNDESGVINKVFGLLQANIEDFKKKIIEELEKHEQDLILKSISDKNRAFLEEGLNFPEDSAGRLMQRELVTVPTFWRVGDTIDFIRKTADSEANTLPKQFYVLYALQ